MHIDIKYNQDLDEFTYDLSLEMRLKNYITKHFPLVYAIQTLAPIYLVGGSIRDLILAKHPKDLDFVILGKEQQDWVLKVFEAFHINYQLNRFGGYKFTYNDIPIDLWLTDDLFSSMEYNVDGLYYYLNTNTLLSLTFNDFENNGLKLVNPHNNIEKGRLKKLTKFEKEYKNTN